MNRLTVIVALVLVGLISAPVLLVITASDDQPTPTGAALPRDEEQQEQQEAQPQPEPSPDDEQTESEQVKTEQSDDPPPQASSESDDDEPSVNDDDPAPPEALDIADVLIRALEVERSQIPSAEPDSAATLMHVIQRGETLSHIAALYQISLSQLIEANDLDRSALLRVGRELWIPIVEPDPEPAPTPEPVDVAPGITNSGIVFGTIRDHERNVVNSAVVALSQSDTAIQLVDACIDGVRRIYVTGLQLPDGPARIYWRIDHGALNTDRWTASDGLVESTRRYPLLNDQTEAETVWLRLGGVDLTFTVANPLPEQIAGNFAICGG